MIGDTSTTSTETSKKTHEALGVVIILGMTLAIYVPAYIRAKRRGDLGGYMARKRKMKGTFCEETATAKSKFDKRSFRYKKSGKAWILIGCPKGKWNAKSQRCRVGTRAHKVLAPSHGGSCPVGSRRISK